MLLDDNHKDDLFLPDFCGVRTVLVVVVLAELLALILTLVSAEAADFWPRLGLASIYIQWIAICGAGVLCIGRRYMAPLGNVQAGMLSYLLLLAVAAICAEMAWWLADDARSLYLIGTLDHGGFVLRTFIITTIVAALILRYLFIQHQWQANVRSELLARIQALQSRIRPHFLFNSLNTVASLVRSQPEAAEQAVLDLAELFRASLGDAGRRVTIAEELALCRQYMNIEKLRLGDRLRFVQETQDLTPECLIPPLTLQPLLENAVYHGIETMADGGEIRLRGAVDGGLISISVENTLGKAINDSGHQGNKLAQDNIRQRLGAWYGSAGQITVDESSGVYCVTVSFPSEVAE